eukprot:1161717-Pelagomonas_calceolata.AAC.12
MKSANPTDETQAKHQGVHMVPQQSKAHTARIRPGLYPSPTSELASPQLLCIVGKSSTCSATTFSSPLQKNGHAPGAGVGCEASCQ